MTKKGKVLASTNDPLGNIVITTSQTWKHIQEHPEMVGKFADVQKVIKEAKQIKETPFSAAFGAFALEEGSGTNDEIRVLVAYDTPNLFTGTATGYVSTAYPIDVAHGSAVGKVIWSSTATAAPVGESKPAEEKKD